MATATLSQGPSLSQAGSDLLRSKSLDRNSYDSGDWFNAIHWDCRDGNGFGRGLPTAAASRARSMSCDAICKRRLRLARHLPKIRCARRCSPSSRRT